jgi:hypothetical protein
MSAGLFALNNAFFFAFHNILVGPELRCALKMLADESLGREIEKSGFMDQVYGRQ